MYPSLQSPIKLSLSFMILLLLFTACNPVPDQNTIEPELNPTEEPITPTAARLPSPQASPSLEPTLVTGPSDTPESSPTTQVPVSPTPPPDTLTPTTELALTETPVQQLAPSSNSGNAIIVDHRSVELFDQIPEEYLEAARELRMVYADRSVGENINDALDCLAAPSWSQTRPLCRRDYVDKSSAAWLYKTFLLEDYQAGRIPELIQFEPDPEKYDRSNWEFAFVDGTWEEVLATYVQDVVPAHIGQKDVLSFQFNYFHISQGSNIASPEDGFFVDLPKDWQNRERWDISDVEALEAQYPEAVFFHWTTSLARSVGSPEGEAFNNQMRAYALANDKILFDVADILSHTEQGQPCFDNRDGVEYCDVSQCENEPDDGVEYSAICQEYTTEINGGHLGSVSGGHLRVAKAFWVLMARIAGWEG